MVNNYHSLKTNRYRGKGGGKYVSKKVKSPFPIDWDKGRCNECLKESEELRAIEIKFHPDCKNTPAATIKKLCPACFKMSLKSGEAYKGQKRILKEWEE